MVLVLAAAMPAAVAVAQARPRGEAVGIARARPGLSAAQSRLMAERGAQVVAARNLLARSAGQARGPVTGYRRVTGTVSGHCYGPARYLPDGRAVVSVRRCP